jgi:carboxyl-terminal processing protease
MNVIFQFMKKHFKILLLVVALSIGLWSFIPKSTPNDPEKDKTLLELLQFVIERYHYKPAAMDDAFSKGIYKDYIEALDPSKRFFLQSDIDEFAKFETSIDDQIKNKELIFFNLTYNRLMQRMTESKTYYKDILAKPFDYNVNETFNTNYEKLPFMTSTAELKDKWRKQIKLSTLSSLTDRLKIQEDLKNGVVSDKAKKALAKNDGKPKDELLNPDSEKSKELKTKSYDDLEKETRESSLKSLNEYFGFIDELDKNDWFSVYINAITARYDPHTNYFAPEEKERFDTSMSGKLEGIGARLQKKNDYVEISELISGGPAWRSKEFSPNGDLILKVAQGNGEALDISGMKLDDVVKKIKGPKGTEVRLTVKKVDGSIHIITLIRDVVEIEETYAKSSIIEKNGLKYGVIYLPKFYIDFDDRNGRDAGKDIALEVERLKKENVQGIIMDVRDNGGGSLQTVVDIGGLFIEDGPIVQIKSAAGKKEVLYDRDQKVEWDGPLVIMQNSFSASASEILAAAMQDYKRAIIIGSKQSYGKGTVQNVMDLNQLMRGSKLGDMGALKTTTQKFYRINGGSTQLEGVTSDVAMPDRYAYLKMGERDIDNAMPWDKIEPANYNVWTKQQNFDKAIQNSKARMSSNEKFKLIEENAKWIDSRDKETTYSLNMATFKKEQTAIEELSKKYKSIADYQNTLKFSSLPYEEDAMKKDLSLKEKRDRWHESLSKDIYVEEAINILDDLQSKNPTATKVTDKAIKSKKVIKS